MVKSAFKKKKMTSGAPPHPLASPSSKVLMYRSNWYQTLESYKENFYIDITKDVEIKKRSLYAHETEVSRRGKEWVDFAITKNKNSGLEIGVKYAEAFECVKWLEE